MALKEHLKVVPKATEQLVISIVTSVLIAGKNQTIQQCIGYLQASMPHEDSFDKAQTAAELLAVCSSETGLYYINRKKDEQPMVIVNHWKTIRETLGVHFNWINSTCFNMPMICKPNKVINNRNCGYKKARVPLVLGSYTQHDEPQNYEVINDLNSIEWVFDKEVLKETEVPPRKLNKLSWKNFKQMIRESNYIYNILKDKRFWLCWQYDSRGRANSHGYHVNFQSYEYKKALLNFSKYEYLS
jgi:hypothetical protein